MAEHNPRTWLRHNRVIWKYCERYQAAKDEGDFDAAYKAIFQLRVEDQVDKDPQWHEFVESKKVCAICLGRPESDLLTALDPLCTSVLPSVFS